MHIFIWVGPFPCRSVPVIESLHVCLNASFISTPPDPLQHSLFSSAKVVVRTVHLQAQVIVVHQFRGAIRVVLHVHIRKRHATDKHGKLTGFQVDNFLVAYSVAKLFLGDLPQAVIFLDGVVDGRCCSGGADGCCYDDFRFRGLWRGQRRFRVPVFDCPQFGLGFRQLHCDLFYKILHPCNLVFVSCNLCSGSLDSFFGFGLCRLHLRQ